MGYFKRSEEVMSTMYQYSFDLIRNSFGQDGIVVNLAVIIGNPLSYPTQSLLFYLYCLSSKPLQISDHKPGMQSDLSPSVFISPIFACRLDI